MIVFSKVMSKDRTNLISKELVSQDLGIEIHHDGRIYIIAVDNYGKLHIRTQESSLIVKPRSANTIELDQED